jgi:hypothetical protein
VNRRLQASHLERCLLMFRNLEIRNGTRDVVHEECLRQILAGLTPAVMATYAERHPRTPVFNLDGRYGLVGGSDDHAGLSIARASTTYIGERSGRGVTAALRERRTAPAGTHGTTIVLEHNVYGVLGGYLAASGQLDEAASVGVADGGGGEGAGAASASAAASATATATSSPPSSLAATLAHYATRLAEAQAQEEEDEAEHQAAEALKGEEARARPREPVGLASIPARGHTDATQAHLAHLLEAVLVKTGREAFAPFVQALTKMHPIELADSLPAIVKSLVAAMPALLGARWHAHDILSARRYGSGLGVANPPVQSPRVAVLTDTIDDVNGVAIGLRRLRRAALAAGHDLRLISWGEGDHVSVDDDDHDGVVRVPALVRHRLADYPEMEFGLPHLPSLLNYLIENRIDLVQCSTPGPVGIMGLFAARLAGIPVVGQYHTDLPEYCTRITGDPMTGVLISKLVGWFYGGMDRVFVPSQAVAARVAELGVAPEKVARMPRGIDLDLFRASRRDPHAFAPFGLNGEPKPRCADRRLRARLGVGARSAPGDRRGRSVCRIAGGARRRPRARAVPRRAHRRRAGHVDGLERRLRLSQRDRDVRQHGRRGAGVGAAGRGRQPRRRAREHDP